MTRGAGRGVAAGGQRTDRPCRVLERHGRRSVAPVCDRLTVAMSMTTGTGKMMRVQLTGTGLAQWGVLIKMVVKLS